MQQHLGPKCARLQHRTGIMGVFRCCLQPVYKGQRTVHVPVQSVLGMPYGQGLLMCQGILIPFIACGRGATTCQHEDAQRNDRTQISNMSPMTYNMSHCHHLSARAGYVVKDSAPLK